MKLNKNSIEIWNEIGKQQECIWNIIGGRGNGIGN